MKNLFRMMDRGRWMMPEASGRRSVRASERGALRHALTLNSLSRLVFLLTLSLALAGAQSKAATNFIVQAGSFVEGFQNFVTVASGVDPADGITYILGHDNAAHVVLRKYDPSGARLFWDGDGEVVTLANLNPSALAVAAGTTNLFIACDTSVLSVSKRSGLVVTSVGANAGVAFKGISYWNGSVYLCGNYSSGSPFGHAATLRGSQSGLLIKMDASLPGGVQALTTFGGNSGNNSAESVVVDDAGDAYVGGHTASGSFTLDGSISLPGQWRVDVVKSSAGVGDLTTALNVLNGVNASSTNTGFFDIINFGTGNDGQFGCSSGQCDATFP